MDNTARTLGSWPAVSFRTTLKKRSQKNYFFVMFWTSVVLLKWCRGFAEISPSHTRVPAKLCSFVVRLSQLFWVVPLFHSPLDVWPPNKAITNDKTNQEPRLASSRELRPIRVSVLCEAVEMTSRGQEVLGSLAEWLEIESRVVYLTGSPCIFIAWKGHWGWPVKF